MMQALQRLTIVARRRADSATYHLRDILSAQSTGSITIDLSQLHLFAPRRKVKVFVRSASTNVSRSCVFQYHRVS